MVCLAFLLVFGPHLSAAVVLVNRSGVPLRLLLTRIQAGGADIQVAVHPDGPDSRETTFLDSFTGNPERPVLPVDLPAGAAVRFSAIRLASAPEALQEIHFRIAGAEGEVAALAETIEGLWATYSVAPDPQETFVDFGDHEMNDSPWDIEPPGPEEPCHRIIPRRSGLGMPCVIL